jgi:hypothetical protein
VGVGLGENDGELLCTLAASSIESALSAVVMNR